MQSRFALLVLAGILSLSMVSWAQMETATLSGVVMDKSGAVIEGARIEITNTDTNSTLATTTSGAGVYVAPGLRPGRYRIVVMKLGFKQVMLTDVVLNVQDLVSHNFTLEIGATSESISVSANGNGAELSPSVATVVDQQLVQELPLNGRSFQTLFQLTPGVVITQTSFNDQGQFSVNGQRTNANYFTIDGASANVGVAAGFAPGQSFGGSLPAMTASGGTNSLVSADAVQEFAIATSGYAAEFGRTPGAQVSVVTRSGTNEVHGSAFDYLRNDVFDANDWIAKEHLLKRAPLRQNDFGVTIGGPILKNKTFYFLSYEGLRLRQPSTGISDVPSVASRDAAPAAIQPYLRAYPLPTGADEENGLAPANYAFSNPTRLDAGSIRLDHHFSDRISVFGRYNNAPSNAGVRAIGSALNTITKTSFSVETLTLGGTYSITPHSFDEFRFNWSRSTADTFLVEDNLGGAVPLQKTAIFPAGINTNTADFLFGIVSGQNALLETGKLVSNGQRQLNVVDNFSWQARAHLLKFGFDYRRLNPTFDGPSYEQDSFFLDVTSALNMSSFFTFLETVNGPVRGAFDNYSLYAEDSWRPNARVNISYGLRWDYNPAATGRAANGQALPAFLNVGNIDALTLAPRGTPLYSATRDNLAPRLGIAYAVRKQPNTSAVVRAGFGIFYDLGDGPVGNAFSSYPFVSSSFNFTPHPFPLTSDDAKPPTFNGIFPVVVAFPRVLKAPYVYHWNFGYEQSLGSYQTLTVNYLGSAGNSLLREDDYTASPPLPPSFTEVQVVTNSGYSNYNALQTVFRRHMTAGLEILGSYTLAHSLDNGSSDQALNVPGQFAKPGLDYASSNFDIRHTVSAALDYQVPFSGRRGLSPILRDWAANVLLTGRTAPPVDIGVQRFLSFGLYTVRPDQVPGMPLYVDDPAAPGGRRFNASALADPLASRQGTLPRNTFRGFPLFQMDFSLRRRFRLTERLGLQARIEAFNVLNHPNFAPPSGFWGNEVAPGQVAVNPGFGISQSMLNQGLQTGSFGSGFSPLYQIGGPRSLQLALKADF